MATETVFPGGVARSAGGKILTSPFEFFATGEDNLRLVTVNSQVGVVLTMQGRRLSSVGKLEVFRETHTPNTDRTAAAQNYPLGVGAVLNITVYASAGSPRIGQTFVMLQLIRGLGSAAIVLGTLLQGYVTGTQALGWPGSPIQSSLEGGGYTRTIVGTQPAAGAELLETVPTGARWELLSLDAQLVTSATVITRQPIARLGTSTGVLFASMNAGTQGASSTNFYYWAQGMPLSTVIAQPVNVGGLPPAYPLLAGSRVYSEVVNLQVGDRWEPPTLHVREWLEVA